MTVFTRLRQMPREEIAWRTAQAARVQRDRLRARMRPPAWERAALVDALHPAAIAPPLRAACERGDWRSVHDALREKLRARQSTFVLDPAADVRLRRQILARWPDAAARAAARADRVVSGHYDLLGYRDLAFEVNGRIDWHFDPVHGRRAPRIFWADVPYLNPEVGDHKIVWELNRHQHWLALTRALWLTGRAEYGAAIVTQLEDWLEHNPPLTGINWASMLELGLRSLSWIWALHALLAGSAEGPDVHRSPWLVDMLVGLDRQLRHVEENPSYYFSPNTHLLGEALALYVAGAALPKLARGRRWLQTGRRILLDEAERQVAPDGGHVERSAHYHRYALDFYLFALLVAERTGDSDATARFTDVVSRLAAFARAMADDDGRLPLLGDDDGGMLWPLAGRRVDDVRDSLALAAVLLARPDLAPWGVPEEVFWIAGETAAEYGPFVESHRSASAPARSIVLPDTGYVVMRDGRGTHLVFDAGPLGYANGGHAHADALSLTLTVGGRPLLIDPGTFTYTMDRQLRDRLRSSASHNTLTLDGRSPSVPSGAFHWRTRTDAHLDASRTNPVFDWAEGSHTGYPGLRHRRSVVRSPGGGWLILDEVLGRDRPDAALHWHFAPAWQVSRETAGRVRAIHSGGATAWIVHDGAESTLFHGDEATGLGWCAPVYGTLVPTWCARVRHSAAAPFAIATWIGTSPGAPALMRLPVDGRADGSPGIAVRVLDDDVVWTTVHVPGDPAGRESRGCSAGAYHTDGRLLHYASRNGRLSWLCACDASYVLATRDGWLTVAADEPVSDLAIHIAAEGLLEVWASRPTARLRLQGALVADARLVLVNGRELPPRARERIDSVSVCPSDFGDPVRMLPCAALQGSRT